MVRLDHAIGIDETVHETVGCLLLIVNMIWNTVVAILLHIIYNPFSSRQDKPTGIPNLCQHKRPGEIVSKNALLKIRLKGQWRVSTFKF